MASFTKPFRSLRATAVVKPLAAVVVVAVLLTVGQVALQARMVEAQIAQAELQAQAEQARAELQVEMEQARIQAEIQAQSVASDRAALVALYNATAGASWSNNTNWDSTEDLEDWHGVTVDANGRVFSVILNNNNLNGTLPADLGNLSRIQTLSLYDNSLSGSIPAELGSLSALTALPLYNNDLSGSIPPELGNLGNLRTLNLSRNDLTGTIPVELGNLNSATLLSLDRNDLTGTIPASLGNLSNMLTMTLHENDLTGTVPTELGNLSRLATLRLNGNDLTGELPLSLAGISTLNTLVFQNNEGLCAPLDTAFQTWFDGRTTTEGPDCPAVRIRASGSTVPVVGEPLIVELTTREHRLLRVNVTEAQYNANPCIGYTDRGFTNGWGWERAPAQAGPWSNANPGRHPHATFVYIPQDNDVGGFLRAVVTYGATTVNTETIGPIVADHGVASGNQVSVDGPTGTLQVGNDLTASLPAAAAAERMDRTINPNPASWQWEQSDDGSTGWTNVTPYHLNCAPSVSDDQYPLTNVAGTLGFTGDETKHLRAHVYYNDDSSGSVVLKRAETASVGPVAP